MTDRDTTSFSSESADQGGVDADDGSNSTVTRGDSTDSGAASDVLTAIADPDCQTILAASAEQSLTVADVVATCDIPTATAYRKVNMLVDAGLLHEQIQIRPYGRNEHKYSLRIDRVHVTITDCGVPEATVTLAEGGTSPIARHALTDGGQPRNDGEKKSGSNKFVELFIDVTGSEKVVNEQEVDRPSRQLTDEGGRSVSEYISTAIRDDGLADSLPESDGQKLE